MLHPGMKPDTCGHCNAELPPSDDTGTRFCSPSCRDLSEAHACGAVGDDTTLVRIVARANAPRAALLAAFDSGIVWE